MSVILAFQLSQFNVLGEWFVWCLLGALALYDLCAVLTPCGPLRLLLNAVQVDLVARVLRRHEHTNDPVSLVVSSYVLGTWAVASTTNRPSRLCRVVADTTMFVARRS